MLGGAIGFAAGGFVLVFLAATSGAPDGPRPPGRTPFANLDPYTAAAKETSYQRKRVALTGVACLVIAALFAVAATVTGS